MSNYNVKSNIDHYPGVSITYEHRDILWSIHNLKIPFEGLYCINVGVRCEQATLSIVHPVMERP